MNPGPIGVFDSGIGGLSVLKEIRRELPHHGLVYVADSAHLPYGKKSPDFIIQRATTLVEFLVEQRRVRAVVVACNTATAAAINALRARFQIPIVGMEPAVKPAAAVTKSGIIGVLATAGTLSSAKFAHLVERFGGSVDVVVQPCMGWVEQVESGDVTSAAARALVQRHIAPLLERGCDTLVLGCTHYPFLDALIRDCAGARVTVVDPSPAVARELVRRLAQVRETVREPKREQDEFWTSGDARRVESVMRALWNPTVVVQALPNNPSKGE